eukprot:TRINITY_DN14747_c0_g1_i1.p1 TRINITY_DN14747_c0_g1~~TRINITY_DN14747_c0_g1_i1.p1  ORF type:complete len:149 (-),score=75.35 TRINITY_DN14747_c0_g1_i1:49-495(-)
MMENQLKDKTRQIDALKKQCATPPPAPEPVGESPAELAAKDKEIEDLKQALQESTKALDKMKHEQNIRIPWSACKLSASAREYMSQLTESTAINGLKRKLPEAVSYTHLRAHETVLDLVCRLLLEKKNKNKKKKNDIIVEKKKNKNQK